MIFKTASDKPNYALAEEVIRRSSARGIYLDSVKLIELHRVTTIKQSDLKNRFNIACGNFITDVDSPKQLLNTLLKFFKIPEENLKKYNKLGTEAAILEKAYIDTHNPVLKLILDYRGENAILKNIDQLIRASLNLHKKYKITHVDYALITKTAEETGFRNDDGHPLLIVNPIFNRKVSSRYCSSEPNIQGMSRAVKPVISAPAGYKILSIDTISQEAYISYNYVLRSELILDKLKTEKKDCYMTIAWYSLTRARIKTWIDARCKLLGNDEQLIAKTNLINFLEIDKKHFVINKDKNEIGYYRTKEAEILKLADRITYDIDKIDKKLRDLFKLCTFKGGYGAELVSLQLTVDQEIAKYFYNAIHSMPAYTAYEEHAKANIKAGNLTTQSYFGTESIIEDNGYGYKLRCFFNRPIQTTGADLLVFTLENIENYKKQNKLSDSDISLCFPEYDAVILYVKDTLADKIQDIVALTEYQIDDWTPMLSEYEYGIYY